MLNTPASPIPSADPDEPTTGSRGSPAPLIMRIFQRPICLIHVPKTGGTAFRHYLESLFYPDEVIRVDDAMEDVFWRHRKSIKNKIAFVSGHFGYNFLEHFEHTPWTLTFIRHPVDRVLSTFHYWKTAKLDGHKKQIKQMLRRVQKMSLEQFLDDPEVRPYIHNSACAAIGQTPTSEPHAVWNPANDKLALVRLDAMDFVGVTERMSESVADAARVLCLPPPTTIPKENVTPTAWSRHLSSSLEDHILDLNQSDLRLWEAANSRLDKALARGKVSVTPVKLDERFRPERSSRGYRLSLASQPLLGSGWLARDHRPDARIAALPGPTTIDLLWPFAGETVVAIVISDIAADVAIDKLRINVDGRPVVTRIVRWRSGALAVAQCDPPMFPDSCARLEMLTRDLTKRKNGRKSRGADQALFAVRTVYWAAGVAISDLIVDLCEGMIALQEKELHDLRAHSINLSVDAESRAEYCHSLMESATRKDRDISALDAEVRRSASQFAELAAMYQKTGAEVAALNTLLRQKELELRGLAECLADQRAAAESVAEFNRELLASAAVKDDYARNLLTVIQRKDEELARLSGALQEERLTVERVIAAASRGGTGS